jgi:CubicO group peptidase (beta-lactamase class C family)
MIGRRALLAAGAGATALAALPGGARAGGLWDTPALDAFRALARDLEVKGLVALHRGDVLVSWGDVAAADRIASCRKSFLSALYGIAVRDQKIDLDQTLAQVGIDDYQPLSAVERSATVRQLLMARSGVYIPSSAETPAMKAMRPARGSHPPGTFWYYNNWDFNALGEIYQRLTGRSVFAAFEHEIAGPLGFQDFDPERHARFGYDADAPRFPAYNLWLSARDMARFGQLYLQQGGWKGRQLVPADWVSLSTRPVSATGRDGILSGYGYLWWGDLDPRRSGLPPGSYAAAGNGGRYIVVMPAIDTVVAIQPAELEDRPQARLYTEAGALDRLLKALVAARRG